MEERVCVFFLSTEKQTTEEVWCLDLSLQRMCLPLYPLPRYLELLSQYLYFSNSLTNWALHNFLSWFPQGSGLESSLSCRKNQLWLRFPFLPPTLGQWIWELLPWLHTNPSLDFMLSLCGLYPSFSFGGPDSPFSPYFIWTTTCWAEGGGDLGKGSPQRHLWTLIATFLTSLA